MYFACSAENRFAGDRFLNDEARRSGAGGRAPNAGRRFTTVETARAGRNTAVALPNPFVAGKR